jgi:hypothetical protein
VWETVVGASRHGCEFFDDGAGQSVVWHSVDGGSDGVLHGADGSFDFGDVVLGSANVKMDVWKEGFDVVIFAVTVDVCDGETPVLVSIDVGRDAFADRWFFPVGDGVAR